MDPPGNPNPNANPLNRRLRTPDTLTDNWQRQWWSSSARRLSSSSRVPCAHYWALGMHAVEPRTAKDVE